MDRGVVDEALEALLDGVESIKEHALVQQSATPRTTEIRASNGLDTVMVRWFGL